MQARPLIAIVASACALAAACAVRDALPPDPRAVAHARDHDDAAELRAHLVALAPVRGASVIIDRTPPDPFAPLPPLTPLTPLTPQTPLTPLAPLSPLTPRSPATPPAPPPPSVAIALVADPAIDPVRLDALARSAAAITVGADARVSIAILPSPDRPDLARLGPFTVAASARRPLLALIAGGLLAIATLAATLTFVLLRRPRR
jgi:hypothetical protein